MKSRILYPWALAWMFLASGIGSLRNSCAAASGPETRADRRPNILFLFTDDQRADTIHALGNQTIITPNLDRLAERGFAFTNAYILGANAGAVCRPSRNMLLSGRAYFRFRGKQKPGQHGPVAYASPSRPNVPDSMNTAGYETYHHGKSGNTARLIHPRFNHSKYVTHHNQLKNGQPGMVIVDEAIDFLKARPSEKPFFLYLGFSEPHDLRIPAKEYLDLYKREKIPLPENYLPVHPFDNGEMAIRDEQLEVWPRTEEAIRRHIHEYYGMITGLDHHIGRLIHTLKELGEWENTVIVFSSDNGLAVGSHGLMGKQSVYEHSAKVPLILAGPGIPRGRSKALVYLLDLFPTFCELSGTPVPDDLDGQSLVPVMTGKLSTLRDTVFYSYRDVQRAVRDDRWKLIRYPQIHRTQLFDLAHDAREKHDLSADPVHAKRIEKMMASLQHWQHQLGDTLPLTAAQRAESNWTPREASPPASTKPPK